MITAPRKEPKVIKSRNFKHYNSNNFKSDLSTYLYDQIFCDTMLDSNIMWENWKTIFLSVADFHAPERTKKLEASTRHGLQKILNKLCVEETF